MKKFFEGLLFGFILASMYYILICSAAKWQNLKSLSNRKEIIFRIDDTFNSNEHMAIESALLKWEKRTDHNVILATFVDDISFVELFFWKSDGFATIYKATSRYSWKTHVAKHLTNLDVHGIAMVFSGDIFIMYEGELFEDIVIHEVGHILINTNWHSKDEKSIMYPNIDPFGNRKIMQQEVDLIKQIK